MAYYDSKPEILAAVGDGSYLYHYNLEEVTLRPELPAQWQCDEVTVWEPVTANKITEAVIAAEFAPSYEQKLVNEFNAAQLGLMPEDEAQAKIAAYRSFLERRASLKAQVDADCAELKIL